MMNKRYNQVQPLHSEYILINFQSCLTKAKMEIE